MLIIDALKALYKKATTKDAAATSIAGVVQEMADNWPAAGGAGAATTEKAGLVKQGAAVADAAGETPTKEEYNALLASLPAARNNPPTSKAERPTMPNKTYIQEPNTARTSRKPTGAAFLRVQMPLWTGLPTGACTMAGR